VYDIQNRDAPNPPRAPVADQGGETPDKPENGSGEENAHRLNCQNRRAAERRSKKNTKAAIRIVSLNIKGWKVKDTPQSKWNRINQMMQEKRIGILLMQEAHFNEKQWEGIENLFKKILKIYHSEDPTNPTGKGGGTVVLNRQFTNVNDVKITEIMPGRAIHIITNWHWEEKINVLGVCIHTQQPG
jgi:hypothetical protein